MRNAIVFLALALFLAACAAPATRTAAPSGPSASAPTLSSTLQPTPSPSLTVSPAPTLTASAVPSPTPVPVISLTPSFFFTLPTPTRVATHELDCEVVSQSVADNTQFRAGERFPVIWKVTNTGTTSWFPASVVFTYVGGSKFYVYSPVHLQNAVAPGQTTGLSADMRAPRNATEYTTLWSLRQGDRFFCPVRVTIAVLEPTPTPTQ